MENPQAKLSRTLLTSVETVSEKNKDLTEMKTASLGLLVAWCLVQFASPSIAMAPGAQVLAIHATYFVDPKGNDSDPGTADHPWATVNHAAEIAVAGDTVVVRGGHYVLGEQVRVRNSGRSDAWISFVGYPGEQAVLDAQKIGSSTYTKGALNNGAFQVERVRYIRLANLILSNSHDAGITVRDASDVDLLNNTIKGTFSSGIAVWDTNHDGRGTERIRVIGNTIIHATTWDLAPPDMPRIGEPPHEALSIGGAVDFEVAYNHVLDSDKEGIVIKETSKRGKVHHNLVEGLARQGMYVGSYFGKLRDIEIFSNVVHDCHGAGFVLSVEQGEPTERINFHNNLVFNNEGSGIYFSRWGVENMRRRISISHNIFYHNGYGLPTPGQTYSWWTGGLYLYSPRVEDIAINDNIFSENLGFQIGYSDLFLKDGRSWRAAMHDQKIRINHNLIFSREKVTFPIESGGASFDQVKIYEDNGASLVFGDPLFRDPAHLDFTLGANSPARRAHIWAGPVPPKGSSRSWWKEGLPSKFSHYE